MSDSDSDTNFDPESEKQFEETDFNAFAYVSRLKNSHVVKYLQLEGIPIYETEDSNRQRLTSHLACKHNNLLRDANQK